MSLVWCEPPAAVDHERSIICATRPRVPLPEQLAARQHEYELAEGRRQRSDRVVNVLIWVLAIALAAGIWWWAR